MHRLTTATLDESQVAEVLDLYVTCAPMGVDRMFGYYLTDWETSVTDESDSLPPGPRALVREAIENNDFETLSEMGFEDPSFFFHVVELLRLSTTEQPAKGRGFTCMLSI